MDQQIIESLRSLGRRVIPSTMGVDILKPTPTLRIDSSFFEYGCHLVINPPTEEIEVEVLNARLPMSFLEVYISLGVEPEQLVLTPAQIKYFIELYGKEFIIASGGVTPVKFLCWGSCELVVVSAYLSEATVMRLSSYSRIFQLAMVCLWRILPTSIRSADTTETINISLAPERKRSRSGDFVSRNSGPSSLTLGALLDRMVTGSLSQFLNIFTVNLPHG